MALPGLEHFFWPELPDDNLGTFPELVSGLFFIPASHVESNSNKVELTGKIITFTTSYFL